MNWPTKNLGDKNILTMSSGGTPSRGDSSYYNGDIIWLKSGELNDNQNINNSEEKISELAIKNSSAKIFPENTLLLAMYGATAGKLGILSAPAATNQAIAGMICKENILYHRYLYYFLLANREKMISRAWGGAQPNLSQTIIKDFEIPFPPLEIQKKVVKKIEELIAKISQAQSLRDSAIQDTNNLIPATISKIFEEGKKKGWEEINFGSKKHIEIIDGDRGKNYPKKSDFTNSGYCLFLNTSNVRHGSFDFVKCDFISKERDEILRKGKLKRGDVVLTTRGTLGNSAYYDKSVPYDNLRLNSGMVILRVNPKELLQRFLLYVLNSPAVIERIEEANSGSAQPQLPIRVLSKIHFILPPLAEQKKIVEKMDALTQKVRELQKLQSETATNLTALKQSVLHKAFQGELIN